MADEVHPLAALLLVIVWETGHRLGAVAALAWEDIDVRSRTVTWRAATDKKRREHLTPMTDAAVNALDRHAARLLVQDRPATGYLFAARNGHPTGRRVTGGWWHRLERAAGIPHAVGKGWHSIRRAFATDLMNEPRKALADLGGWRDEGTISRCYQRPDTETLRNVLERRPRYEHEM